MCRTIYLSKLPRFEKKLRVALDWIVDLLFTKDLVQFQTFRAPIISHKVNPMPCPVARLGCGRHLFQGCFMIRFGEDVYRTMEVALGRE